MLVVYFFACLLPMDGDVRRASHQIFPADRRFVTYQCWIYMNKLPIKPDTKVFVAIVKQNNGRPFPRMKPTT